MIRSIFLNFNGDLEDAFNYYKDVFGGEIIELKKYREMPHGDALPVEEQNLIMNGVLDIGGSQIEGCDILRSWGQSIEEGNNFYINIAPENKEKAYIIFNRLAKGGEIYMPLQDTYWGSFFGSLKDRYGIQWMINM